MKKIVALIMLLILASCLASCTDTDNTSYNSSADSGAANADTQEYTDDTQSDDGDTHESTPESSDGDGGSNDEYYLRYLGLPDDYDHSFDYTLLGEDGEQIFIPETELDSELRDRIYSLLFAAADGDWDKYLELLDIEEYTAALLGGDISVIDSDTFNAQLEFARDDQLDVFTELGMYLGGDLSGRIRQINYYRSDYLSTDSCEVYYLSFVVPGNGYDVNVDADVFYSGGTLSVGLEIWSAVDHAYYDYEELIIRQMNAASAGDAEAFMELADTDLYIEVLSEMFGEDYSLTADELQETKEITEETALYSYENLSEVLGENFDGRVIQVQQFEMAEGYTDSSDAELYGRIVLTVRNSAGDYQEVEGYCYSLGGRKGVWLQPD